MRFFEAKAYGLHDTSNPLFPRAEKPSRKKWLVAGVIILVAAAGLGTLGWFIYGPYFKLNSIELDGVSTLDAAKIELSLRQQLVERRLFIFPSDQKWFFDAHQAEDMLKATYPLKSVEITKNRNSLRVVLVEDVFMIAFRSGDDVYFLDRSGNVLRLAEPPEKAAVLVKAGVVTDPGTDISQVPLHEDMPIITEKTATPHAVGDQLFSDDKLQNIIAFSAGLREQGIVPKEFVSDDVTLPWFTVKTDQPYDILFDAAKDTDTQLEVLKAVRNDYFATQEGSMPKYVDVRFGTRVYVR